MTEERKKPQRPESDDQDSKPDPNRRDVLNKVVFGAGAAASVPLSSAWSRPVINTVVLPAHGQTTDPVTTGYDVTICVPVTGDGTRPPEVTTTEMLECMPV